MAVALKPGVASLDGQELAQFVAGRIAKFKVPTRIFLWPEDLPRGATGKIPKRDLRDDIASGKTKGVIELTPPPPAKL